MVNGLALFLHLQRSRADQAASTRRLSSKFTHGLHGPWLLLKGYRSLSDPIRSVLFWRFRWKIPLSVRLPAHFATFVFIWALILSHLLRCWTLYSAFLCGSTRKRLHQIYWKLFYCLPATKQLYPAVCHRPCNYTNCARRRAALELYGYHKTRAGG